MRELPRLYLLGPFLPFVGTVSPHSPLFGGPDPGLLSGTLLCAPDALAPPMAVMGGDLAVPGCRPGSAGPGAWPQRYSSLCRGWEESGGTRLAGLLGWGGQGPGQQPPLMDTCWRPCAVLSTVSTC